jgi:hypothetical protein
MATANDLLHSKTPIIFWAAYGLVWAAVAVAAVAAVGADVGAVSAAAVP